MRQKAPREPAFSNGSRAAVHGRSASIGVLYEAVYKHITHIRCSEAGIHQRGKRGELGKGKHGTEIACENERRIPYRSPMFVDMTIYVYVYKRPCQLEHQALVVDVLPILRGSLCVVLSFSYYLILD